MLVRGSLSGESLAMTDLNYDFDALHVGLVAKGIGSANAVRSMVDSVDCASLVVQNEDGATWAWLGAQAAPDVKQLTQLVSSRWPQAVSLGLGEPAQGPPGWRQSHLQASAAFLLARSRGLPFSRYGDDPMLASAMRDDLLAGSLREMYLKPIRQERNGGGALIKTVRAYIDSEKNISSTAAALGVTRQTVSNRLQQVEQRIERPLRVCLAELDIALRLAEIENRRSFDDGQPIGRSIG
jgi:DNA-binding PucR family transcriptional regulator